MAAADNLPHNKVDVVGGFNDTELLKKVRP